jgi:predicted ATPase
MIYLAAISKKGEVRDDTFPFNVPTIQKLQRVELRQPVTFLVGENGSGKSTLLEAVAAGIGSVVVGGEDIERDDSLEHARRLAAHLRLSWRKKTGRGFFLRAEDFFNFSKRINRTGQELQEIIACYEAELQQSPTMRAYAAPSATCAAKKRRLHRATARTSMPIRTAKVL